MRAVALARGASTFRRLRLPTAAATLVVLLASCVPDPGRADRTRADYLRVLAAEDARPTDGPELALLVASTEHAEPLVRRAAVRALGRLESSEYREAILRRLGDPAASVRAAAAMALAPSTHGGGGEPALAPLLERVPLENDPTARGQLARALGRLRLSSDDRERALEAMLVLARRLAPGQGGEAPRETLLGAALGLEALIGQSEEEGVSLAAAERLEELLAYRREDAGDVQAAQVRAMAVTALASARRLSLDLVLLALDDPDAEVRRRVVRDMDAVVPSRRLALVRGALEDPSDHVAVEAIRLLAARMRTEESCALILTAARHPSVAVRLDALAALATPCPGPAQGTVLRDVAGALDTEATWHAPVQALRSLTRIDPDAATRLLPRFAEHADPFVRAHAARAAAVLGDRRALSALSLDESANVRTAAIEGLFAIQGHAIDPLLRAHLEADDPWLLLTAAGLLAGSPRPAEAAHATLDAFERVSETGRETLRDPRRALLARVAELGHADLAGLGDAGLAERLRPYLADYDPLVAADVAAILERWTGEPQAAAPRPPPRAPLPSLEELEALERTTVTLHMRGLGAIVIRVLPHSAITNARRFVQLAAEGAYDGLTFHRYAPNFVIQGGSPGANEYTGHGPYTRDEIELPHWRATVGVSTRGRDTGDGQIFINLVHNPALDSDYTAFGVVTEGMDVADRVLEGAVIERAEVRVLD